MVEGHSWHGWLRSLHIGEGGHVEAGTITVLVVSAVFVGSIVWLAILSRRQSARQETPSAANGAGEESPETTTATPKDKNRKRK